MRCHVANQLEYLFDVLDLSAALLPRHYGMLLQRVAAVWSSRQQDAFDALKAALASAPVLAFPDPTLPYTVSTDASDYAIGAVLQQDRGSGLQPISFLSRQLNDAERNYPVHEKNC